jgi:hypothetical protein
MRVCLKVRQGDCIRMLLVYYLSTFRLLLKSWILGSGTGAWAKRLLGASYAVTACDFKVPKNGFEFPYHQVDLNQNFGTRFGNETFETCV